LGRRRDITILASGASSPWEKRRRKKDSTLLDNQMRMNTPRAALIVSIALAMLNPRTSSAQTSIARHERLLPAASVQASAGPTLEALSSAVHVSSSPSTTPYARNGAYQRQNQTLMVLGGASLLVGAIIGGKPGTVFMVSGAVVGLYGLYKYLQ
jgi:hypothetical protein